jgi:hypothetical protein
MFKSWWKDAQKMKFLLLLVLVFFSSFINAQEVNLICDLTFQSDVTGRNETQKFRTRVEIFQTKDFLSIIPDSDLLGSVSTSKRENSNFTNYSNGTKWDLQRRSHSKDGVLNVHIIIDRNAGTMSYNSSFLHTNTLTSYTRAFGECQKIDVSKKKF